MYCLKAFSISIILLLLSVSVIAQKKQSENNINKIINVYLEIKNALISNDGTTAKYKANELYNLFASQPDKGLNSKQSRLLADYIGPLLSNTRQISTTISEDEQRPYFAGLSKNLSELLKGLKVNIATIYVQYCPVNNLYWLSESPVIKNPYYHDYEKDMISCGKTTATIVGTKNF